MSDSYQLGAARSLFLVPEGEYAKPRASSVYRRPAFRAAD
jgi:hypothetical protein